VVPAEKPAESSLKIRQMAPFGSGGKCSSFACASHAAVFLSGVSILNLFETIAYDCFAGKMPNLWQKLTCIKAVSARPLIMAINSDAGSI